MTLKDKCQTILQKIYHLYDEEIKGRIKPEKYAVARGEVILDIKNLIEQEEPYAQREIVISSRKSGFYWVRPKWSNGKEVAFYKPITDDEIEERNWQIIGDGENEYADDDFDYIGSEPIPEPQEETKDETTKT